MKPIHTSMEILFLLLIFIFSNALTVESVDNLKMYAFLKVIRNFISILCWVQNISIYD